MLIMCKRMVLGRSLWSFSRHLRIKSHHNINSGSILSPVICCVGSPVSERTALLNSSCATTTTKTTTTKSTHKTATPSSSLNFYYFSNFNFKVSHQCRQFSKSTFIMSESNGSAQNRQNYHETSEALVNKQINMELYASYVYMSMAYYFDRDDIAFPGMHKFFKKSSDEEREHAEKLMKYQNSRGGRIVLQPIAKPTNDEWTSPLTAMQAALDLEKTVNQTLLELHSVAGRNGDVHLCDFLETHYLDEQVQSIKELSDYVTQLKRVGSGLGEYIFDKELSE